MLRRFRDLPEAEIASAALASAGVENALRDAETIGILWTYSNGLGGIRLEVPDRDAEDADALLISEGEGGESPAGQEAGEPGETCPNCGSPEVLLDYGSRPTLALWLLLFPIVGFFAARGVLALALVLVLFGLPAVLWRTRARCRACGWSRAVPPGMPMPVAIAFVISTAGFVLASFATILFAGFVVQLFQKIR